MSLNDLIKTKSKQLNIVYWLIIIIMLIFFTIILTVDIYDTEQINGVVKCQEECFIEAILVAGKKLDNNSLVYLENKKIDIKEITIGDLEYDYLSNTSYRVVKISTEIADAIRINNLAIDLKICTNKEKIIKKIVNAIFERK